MNRGQIRDEIRRMVQDTDTDITRQRWTDQMLNDRIDMAHEEVCSLTRCIQGSQTDSVVAGTNEYNLPQYCLEVVEAMYLDPINTLWNLDKVTEAELSMQNPNWRADTGATPQFYYVERNLIGLYPIPNYSRTNGLKYEYISRPTTFASDSSIPFNGLYDLYPYHDILTYKVAEKCKIDELKYTEAQGLSQIVALKTREMKYHITGEAEGTRMENIYEQARSNPRRTR